MTFLANVSQISHLHKLIIHIVPQLACITRLLFELLSIAFKQISLCNKHQRCSACGTQISMRLPGGDANVSLALRSVGNELQSERHAVI